MAYQDNLFDLVEGVETFDLGRTKACLMWYNSKSGAIYSFSEPPTLQFRYTTRVILECIDNKPFERAIEIEGGRWSIGLEKALEQINEFNQDRAARDYDTIRILPKRVPFAGYQEPNVEPADVKPYSRLKELFGKD